MTTIHLQKGTLLRHKYKGGWEYAIADEVDNDIVITAMLIGPRPDGPGRVVECVWEGPFQSPRREVRLKQLETTPRLGSPYSMDGGETWQTVPKVFKATEDGLLVSYDNGKTWT